MPSSASIEASTLSSFQISKSLGVMEMDVTRICTGAGLRTTSLR